MMNNSRFRSKSLRPHGDLRQYVRGNTPTRDRRIRHLSIAGLVVASFVTLAGCAGKTAREIDRDDLLAQAPELNQQLFGQPRPVPDFSELTALTPEQESDFLRFFRSGVESRFEPHKRLYAYLTRELADTDFEHRTLPASKTIETHSGNCMSLALVTTAYARLADIKIGWQLADTDPVYSSEGSVIYSANHIQTRLYHRDYDRAAARFSLRRPYLLVDYFTGAPPREGEALRREEVVALVYQNMGVEAMAEGRLEDSYWLLSAGLNHDPANPNLYNALGVLHRRAGDERTAEKLYRFTLDKFDDRLIVLRNYRNLLLASNRTEEADRLEGRIMALPDPDPYPLLALGDEAAEKGKVDVALAHYRKAGEVAPYLHEVYLKIARIHADNGDRKRAERALREARDRARDSNQQEFYAAKLDALEKH